MSSASVDVPSEVTKPRLPEPPEIPDARRWVHVTTSTELLADLMAEEKEEGQETIEGFTHWVYVPDYLPAILLEPDLAQDLTWLIDELMKVPGISQAVHYDREVLAVTSTLSSEDIRSLVATALKPHISPKWREADRRPFDLDMSDPASGSS